MRIDRAGDDINRLGLGSFTRRGRRRAILSGHIARKLVVAVVASSVVLGGVAAIPGYYRLQAQFASGVRDDTTRLVQAAIDARTYPPLSRLVAIGDHLTRTSDVVGGVFVTGIGEERGAFGETPQLTWMEARLGEVPWRLAENNARFEMFLGPELTGISYGLLLRVDTRESWARAVSRASEILLLGLVALLGLAITTGIIARRMICEPLRRLDAAVAHALDDPENATGALSRLPTHDEFGRLSRTIDQLLFAVSITYAEDLPAAQAMIERARHGVLTFSPSGHLLSANAAALALFGARSFDDLVHRESGCVFRFEGRPTVAPKLLAKGPAFGPGEIVRPDATIPCLVAGDVVRDSEGALMRYFVMLVDMSRVVSDMREQIGLRQKAEQEKQELDERLARLRHRFEACLVLLETETEAQRVRPVTIDPPQLIGGWLDKAVARGAMTPDGVVHDELPALRGDPGEMRRLFEAALEAVRLRAAEPHPRIIVSATCDEEGFGQFTFRGADRTGEQPVGVISPKEDVALFLGAIGALARREGGQLLASQIGDNGNAIGLKLPLDRDSIGAGQVPAETAA